MNMFRIGVNCIKPGVIPIHNSGDVFFNSHTAFFRDDPVPSESRKDEMGV